MELLEQILFIGQGVVLTLKIMAGSLVLSLCLSMVVSVLRYTGKGTFFWNRVVSLLRGAPPLLFLTFWYFSFPALFGVHISILFAGVLAFGLQSFAYVAEIMRAGIESIPKGQFEAAQTLHIPKFYLWKDVILPQVVRNLLPALVGENIGLLKETAMIATIGGMDIMRHTQVLAAEQYTYLVPICIAGGYYYSLILIIECLVTWCERKRVSHA